MGFLTYDDLGRMLSKLGLLNAYEQLVGARTRKVNAGQDTQTLTAAMSGQMFENTGHADAVFTLPAVTVAMRGVFYKFTNRALSSSTGLSISPNAADGISGAGLTGVVNKDLINSGASDVLGDFVVIECTGKPGQTDAWIITDIGGIWAKEG